MLYYLIKAMKKLRCAVGIHYYGRWDLIKNAVAPDAIRIYQRRRCACCGYTQQECLGYESNLEG